MKQYENEESLRNNLLKPQRFTFEIFPPTMRKCYTQEAYQTQRMSWIVSKILWQ